MSASSDSAELQYGSTSMVVYPLLLSAAGLWLLHWWQQQTRFYKILFLPCSTMSASSDSAELQYGSTSMVVYPLLLSAAGLWLLHWWQQQTRFYKILFLPCSTMSASSDSAELQYGSTSMVVYPLLLSAAGLWLLHWWQQQTRFYKILFLPCSTMSASSDSAELQYGSTSMVVYPLLLSAAGLWLLHWWQQQTRFYKILFLPCSTMSASSDSAELQYGSTSMVVYPLLLSAAGLWLLHWWQQQTRFYKILFLPCSTMSASSDSAELQYGSTSMVVYPLLLSAAGLWLLHWWQQQTRFYKILFLPCSTMSASSDSAELQYGSTSMVVYPLLLSAAGLWLLHWWQQQTRFYKMGNLLPGPSTLPFFGNALVALGKKPDQLVDLALEYGERYGSVVRGWLGPKLLVFLTDPHDVELILNSHVHIDKASEYRFFKPWLGEGLLISSGDKWRSHRKMIAPTFHLNILKSFVDVFNQNSQNVVNNLRKEVGKTFDVHDHMSGVTVDILLETAMGISKKTQDKSGYDYAMAVMKMCDIIHQRHYKFWLRFDAVFKFTSFCKEQVQLLNIIHGLTNKVIKNKKATYLANKAKGIIPPSLEALTRESVKDEPDPAKVGSEMTLADTVFRGIRDDLDDNDENDIGEKKRLAFLDLMLESAQNGTNNITDHEIKEEVDTIMFEGHDTTAAGSSFVLCLLGVHQQVQARVYDELYSIFGDSDRPATFKDTLEMKYLERVIFESLRMYPPVPIIARKLNNDIKIATKNYVIPRGATVVIATFKVHRNPDYYNDPEVFNPDNFLPENTQDRHYYSYIPFSAGPRSCVGRKYALLKLKVLLSTILRNYRMVSNLTEKDFRLQADIILKRSDGFRLQIEPRKRVPSASAAAAAAAVSA